MCVFSLVVMHAIGKIAPNEEPKFLKSNRIDKPSSGLVVNHEHAIN